MAASGQRSSRALFPSSTKKQRTSSSLCNSTPCTCGNSDVVTDFDLTDQSPQTGLAETRQRLNSLNEVHTFEAGAQMPAISGFISGRS